MWTTIHFSLYDTAIDCKIQTVHGQKAMAWIGRAIPANNT